MFDLSKTNNFIYFDFELLTNGYLDKIDKCNIVSDEISVILSNNNASLAFNFSLFDDWKEFLICTKLVSFFIKIASKINNNKLFVLVFDSFLAHFLITI